MKNFKIYLSIALSLLLNSGIFYNLTKKQSNWEISQNNLKAGANTSGLTENMQIANINLVTPVAKSITKSKAKQIPSKPMLQKAAKDQPLSKKPENNHETKQQVKPATSVASGEASPKIVKKARLKSSPPPLIYPPGAIAQNAIGKVGLKAFIDIEGKISKIEIIASSGYKILDDAAIEWFKQLSFYPAHDGQSQTGSFVSQTISFSLNDITQEVG